MQHTDLIHKFTLSLFNDLLHLIIIEPAVGIDHRAAKPLVSDIGLAIHFKYGRKTEFILIGTE